MSVSQTLESGELEPLVASLTIDEGTIPNLSTATPLVPGLKKIAPYWHPYRTFAKERWRNREILELVSTEFRDRSVEYYVRSVDLFICFGSVLI